MKMPDYKSRKMTLGKAQADLRKKNANLIVAMAGDPQDPVAAQIPFAGHDLLDRSQVLLSSKKLGDVKVPDLSEITPPTVANVYAYCRNRLDLLIREPGNKSERRPERKDEQRIIERFVEVDTGTKRAPDTEVPAGTKVPRGTRIVGELMAEERTWRSVPSVIGKKVSEAEKLLSNVFVGSRRTRRKTSATRRKSTKTQHRGPVVQRRGRGEFTVQSQWPPPGATITRATRRFFFSAAPNEILVPDELEGMSVQDAALRCEDDGLILAVCDGSESNSEACTPVDPDDPADNRVVSAYHPSTPPGSPIFVGESVGIMAIGP